MRMFADDSIAYRQKHTPADYFTLASDLNKLPGGYHQHKIIVSTTYQQSAEQSKQDNWLPQKNTACGATASETNGIRGTRATKARVCHMRLGTSHTDRHSYNRARTKIS